MISKKKSFGEGYRSATIQCLLLSLLFIADVQPHNADFNNFFQINKQLLATSFIVVIVPTLDLFNLKKKELV